MKELDLSALEVVDWVDLDLVMVGATSYSRCLA